MCLTARLSAWMKGRSQFNELLFHRAEPHFYAFDVLWDQHAKTDDENENRRFRNGEDLRYERLDGWRRADSHL